MNALDRIFRVPFKDERGFTLPEVLTTVLILGILLSIATASWFGVIESRRVDSAANQLAADMRLAHSSATNQLTTYSVVYNNNGAPVTNCSSASYCLVKGSGSGAQKTPRFLPDGTKIIDSTLNVDPTTLLGPGTRNVEFRPDGSAQPLGGISGATVPRITVGPKDSGTPKHDITFVKTTSKVQVD